MANKILTFMLIMSLGVFVKGNAQDVATLKSEVNKIKKDATFIYGEGVAETEDVCEKLAESELKDNLLQYIKSTPELDTAEAVIMPPIKKIMKRIKFDRTILRKVVFLYVQKSEIIPLLIGKQKGKDVIREEKKVSDSVVVKSPSPKELDCQGLSIKDVNILKDIISRQTFEDIREYLIVRKSTNHDLQYRGTNSFSSVSEPGYWIVFNSNRMIVAILGKDAKTVLYNKDSNKYKDFSSNGKIWLSIY